MRYEPWEKPGPADPLGLMAYRHYTKLEQSMLPGADRKRKAELKAMYDNLPPGQRQMLNSIRAQRGLDAIDICHAVARHEWGAMTSREKAIWNTKISPFTTYLAAKLKGAARFA